LATARQHVATVQIGSQSPERAIRQCPRALRIPASVRGNARTHANRVPLEFRALEFRWTAVHDDPAMSDILPLLLLPAVVGWWISEWKQRTARPMLRAAIAAARPPMLVDAGRESVIAVARSLHIAHATNARGCPWWLVGRRRRAWDVRELVAPLGLELTDVARVRRDRLGRSLGFVGASRFAGVRHGRQVDVELATDVSTIAGRTGRVLPSFTVTADASGALSVDGEAPAAVVAAAGVLAPSRRWRGVVLDAVGDRVVLRRPGASSGSWLHDLWLAKRGRRQLRLGASAPRYPPRFAPEQRSGVGRPA